MKPKGVTTQMKALDEYNLMVLFVRESIFLQMKPKGVTALKWKLLMSTYF